MISGTDAATVRAALEAVGRAATHAATLVLVGGCNLAVRGIKSATKDVDLVLAMAIDPADVLHAFQAIDFAVADGYYLPGAPLDPHTMLEDPRGLWVDLFLPDRLFGALTYSPEMAARDEAWFTTGPLAYRLADPSVVFLLKSVTGRWRKDPERDIPDLVDLVDRGLVDWGFVQTEWRRQCAAHPHPDALRAVAREARAHLADRGYQRLPWAP